MRQKQAAEFTQCTAERTPVCMHHYSQPIWMFNTCRHSLVIYILQLHILSTGGSRSGCNHLSASYKRVFLISWVNSKHTELLYHSGFVRPSYEDSSSSSSSPVLFVLLLTFLSLFFFLTLFRLASLPPSVSAAKTVVVQLHCSPLSALHGLTWEWALPKDRKRMEIHFMF